MASTFAPRPFPVHISSSGKPLEGPPMTPGQQFAVAPIILTVCILMFWVIPEYVRRRW